MLIKLEKVSRIRLVLLLLAESYDYFATKRGEDLNAIRAILSGVCGCLFEHVAGNYCLYFLGTKGKRGLHTILIAYFRSPRLLSSFEGLV